MQQSGRHPKLACNLGSFSCILLASKDRPIVEDSHKDTFWGAKTTKEDEQILIGQNVLGRLLSLLRDLLWQHGAGVLRVVAPPDIANFLLYDVPIRAVEGKDLRNANLTRADLSHADLISADIQGAILKDADIRGANLSHADLRSANLRGANFSDCLLTGATFDGTTTYDTFTQFPQGFDPVSHGLKLVHDVRENEGAER